MGRNTPSFHASVPVEPPKKEQQGKREKPSQALLPEWERPGAAMRWTPPTTDEGDASGEALPWLGGAR